MFAKLSAARLFLTVVSSVSAHGALVAVAGTNGVDGQGFGVDSATPRDGTRREPFQVCYNLPTHTHARIYSHVRCTGRHINHSRQGDRKR